MKKMKNASLKFESVMNFFVLFLLFTVAVNLIVHVKTLNDWGEILWFCNFVAILLAIGIFFRNVPLISSVFFSAVPAQFLWIADYFLTIFGKGIGRVGWLFYENTSIFILSTILHGSLIPISFYACYKLGYSKRAYIYGLILFALILLPVTFYATSYEENRNCVFFDCDLDWEANSEEILENDIYMTQEYLARNVIFWVIILTLFHPILLLFFKKFGKVVR
jgi:hypothetical protein